MKIKQHLIPKEPGLIRVERQSLKDFCEKYELKVKSVKCDGCDRRRRTTIPFYSKNYVHLVAPRCECGSDRDYGLFKPRSNKEKDFWKKMKEVFFSNLQ